MWLSRQRVPEIDHCNDVGWELRGSAQLPISVDRGCFNAYLTALFAIPIAAHSP
jgi:hypothetical protein